MTQKPVQRKNSKRVARDRTDDDHGSMTAALKRLIDIGPYHRNEVGITRLNVLRDQIDREGRERTAEKVGVSVVTLLSVTSGFGHKLRPNTAAKFREYFGE